jgi:hypothetical protein
MRPCISALALCLLGTLFGAGCSTPVKIDYKTGTDFSKYHTFEVMPLPQSGPAEDPGLMMRIAQPAKEAVIAGMATKGLVEAPTNEADLAIHLQGQAIPRVDVTGYGYTYPTASMRYGVPVTAVYGPGPSVNSYTERRLIIEMFDNHSKELVWVGWTKKNSNKPVKTEVLQEAIRNILEKYPPTPSP